VVETNIHVYRLSDPLSNAAFRGSVDDVSTIWRAQRGEPLRKPITVSHMSGTVLKDFVWTGAVAPLVNRRVVSLLNDSGVSGWTTFPVTLVDDVQRKLEEYVGLAFTGRCNWIDFDRREESLIYKPNRSGGQTRYFKGLKFDKQSWDGADFFMDADAKTGWVLVTERVRRVFKERKVQNCAIEALEEIELIAQRSDIIPSTIGR
jgi:hypothetical protein